MLAKIASYILLNPLYIYVGPNMAPTFAVIETPLSKEQWK